MPNNKEGIVFQLEADDSGIQKKILDVEKAAESAAASASAAVKSAAEKVKASAKSASESAKASVKSATETAKTAVGEGSDRIYSDIAKNNEKIKSVLNNTESSLKSKAMSISSVYRSEGMNQSDAMKKAWEQIERSSAGAFTAVKKSSGTATGKVKSDIQSVAKATKVSATQMRNTASGTASSIGSAFSGMAKKIGIAMAAAFSIGKLASFGKDCLSLGSHLAEVENVVDNVFPNMQSRLDEFAENASKNFGLSELSAKQYIGTFGSMAEAFGYSEQSAYQMSESLAGLTGDVASFYDKTADESYTMLKSIFTGETETLKNIGVVMTQSALDAFALANGYGKTTSSMSEAEKVALRYAFVQEQVSKAQGDYARTSDGWANSTKTLSEQFSDLKSTLGQGLINVLSPVVQWLNKIVEQLSKAATKFKEFTAAVMGTSVQDSGAGASVESTEALNSALIDTESDAKAATKAMRDLMGFDEINRLSDNSSTTSSVPTIPDTSTGSVNPDATDNGSNISVLEGPLKRIKDLWNGLYASFKNGLKLRLDTGNVAGAFATILENLKHIKETITEIFTDNSVTDSISYMLHQISEYYGSTVGNFISIGANLAAAITTGISNFLDEKKQFLQEKLSSIFTSIGDIFGFSTQIQNDITDIINTVLQLESTAHVISNAINIVVTPIMTVLDLLLKFVRDNLAGLSQVISDNKDGFIKIGTDIMGFLETVTGAISTFVDGVCAKAEEVYTQYIKPAIDNIWTGINNLVTFLVGIWEQYVSPFLEKIGEDISIIITEHLKPMFDKLMEVVGKAVELISVLWKNYVEPFVEWFVANIAPIIMPILRELWALIKLVVTDVIDHIKRVLEILGGVIDFLIGVFTGDWSRAWDGIKQVFSGATGLISDKLDNMKTFFSDTFENIKTTVEQAVQRVVEQAVALYQGIQEKFNKIKTFLSGFWTGVKGIFSNVKGFFKEKFSAAVDGIKEAFRGVKEWFSKLFDDLVGLLKAPINAIIDILNYLIGKLNSLSIDVPDWVPGIGGETFGFTIPDIPHLATGGYVKANTPQLAMIGDNKREGEIVAPESKIAEAVAKAMQLVLAKMDGMKTATPNQNESTLQANIYLGNELLATKMARLQKLTDYRSGGLA